MEAISRKYIGGSDAPVIVLGDYFGKKPYQLWLEKTGRVPLPELDTPDIRRGIRQEDVAAAVYEEKTGQKLRRVKRELVHAQFDFMRAHIDREILNEDAVLEIKCPRTMTYRKWQLEGVPAGPQIQGHHYLAVKGKGTIVFAIFCAELDEIMIVPIERDDQLIDLILDVEQQFWSFVEADEFPEIAPPAEISLPAIGGDLVKLETAEWARAASALQAARELKQEAEAIESQAKAQIITLMEDNPIVEGAGLRVYYKDSPGKTTFDSKRLKAENPELWKEYAKAGKPYKSFRPFFLKGGSYDGRE